MFLCPERRRSAWHCQSKFYTACLRIRAGQSPTVFAHESPTRSAGFDAENGLYLFALTVPFALFGLAWAYKLAPEPRFLSAALTTLGVLDQHFASPTGGYHSVLPADLGK